MDEWVFIDTCIWASFFSKPNCLEKAAVDDLLDSDRVACVGPILAEILIGCRRKDQANWIASRMRMAHYLEAEWNDWVTAAELVRDLTAKGNKLPLTDLVVAAITMRCKASV